MTDEKTLKTELARLLLAEAGPSEAQIAHREGRIRGIVFALTGKDVGYGCGVYGSVKTICECLGWDCVPYGVSGWEIDWRYEVDEASLKAAGVEIVQRKSMWVEGFPGGPTDPGER
jgi:hypothetical protein